MIFQFCNERFTESYQ